MKHFLAVLALIGVLATPSLAQDQSAAPTTLPNPSTSNLPVVIPPLSPATQNTVTTSGPVSSNTTISVGTLAGQFLAWATLAFGSVLSTLLGTLIYRGLKLVGVKISDAARARLGDIILNAINFGAKKAEEDLAGKDPVEIKNAAVALAVAYTQAHGADTIKTLGLDPTSGAAVEAIKARIQTAIADPAVPTPAVLDAPVPPNKAV